MASDSISFVLVVLFSGWFNNIIKPTLSVKAYHFDEFYFICNVV